MLILDKMISEKNKVNFMKRSTPEEDTKNPDTL
jgi:hypothetical protein